MERKRQGDSMTDGWRREREEKEVERGKKGRGRGLGS